MPKLSPGYLCKYSFIVVTLAVINMVVYINIGSSSTPVVCSADSMLQSISEYIFHGAEITLKTYMTKKCVLPTQEREEEFATTIREFVQSCRRQHLISRNQPIRNPFVTLFTTHASHNHSDDEKVIVHNNTLTNWASFKPKVNLVLFTNDAGWTKHAKSNGWDVMNVEEPPHQNRPPILKAMFEKAMKAYNTSLYGYVNADILFTSDFIETLDFIVRHYNDSTARVLMTGRRTNIDNLTAIEATSDSKLRECANKFGTLYKEDAEDYFITTKSFPWQRILPVVVGRPAYDNWLVSEARCRLNTTVIDVTKTMAALHQTTQKGGNKEGHSHGASVQYNYDLFKSNNVTPNYIAGLTTCIEHETYRTLCGTVHVRQRTALGSGCVCTKKLRSRML